MSNTRAGAAQDGTQAVPSVRRGDDTGQDAKAAGGAPETVHEPMTVQTANALITGAPATDEQLHAARRHFAALESGLAISGPRFANARAQAADLHNVAVRRIRESAEQRRQRAARTAEVESGLVEIEV